MQSPMFITDAESDKTLSEILAEMDAFGPENGIDSSLVCASTIDVLAQAMQRPGRHNRGETLARSDSSA